MILASNRERTYLHILLQRADGSPASETVALCGSKIGKERHGSADRIKILRNEIKEHDGMAMCKKCCVLASERLWLLGRCPCGEKSKTDGEITKLCDECEKYIGPDCFSGGHLTPRQAIKKV